MWQREPHLHRLGLGDGRRHRRPLCGVEAVHEAQRAALRPVLAGLVRLQLLVGEAAQRGALGGVGPAIHKGLGGAVAV